MKDKTSVRTAQRAESCWKNTVLSDHTGIDAKSAVAGVRK